VPDEWMIVNNKLERIWKEAVIAYVKVLSQHFAGVTEDENDKVNLE
jgi:hypothetical protein